MRKINDWLQKTEIFVCVFLMTITFIIILAHITGRYIFHYPFYFAKEISRYCLIFTIMIGAGLGLRRNIHTRVVFFISFLSPRATHTLNILRGLFMETTASLIILVPILVPMVTQLGIDPVAFGLVMVLTLMLGLITPPVGVVLYLIADIAGISFEDLVAATFPFLLPLLIVLLLITFVPQIAMFLPNLLMP